MKTPFLLPLLLIAGIVEAEAVALDFGFFEREIQPIFLAKRPGNMRCVDCHAGKAFSGFNLEPLPDGAYYWDEAASRKNFAAASSSSVTMHSVCPEP